MKGIKSKFWVSFLAFALSGCSMIGGIVGHQKDKLVPQSVLFKNENIMKLKPGSMINLKLKNSEPIKVKLISVNKETGAESLKVTDGALESNVALTEIEDVVAVHQTNKNLIKGAFVGGAIDLFIVGSGLLIYYETQKMHVNY